MRQVDGIATGWLPDAETEAEALQRCRAQTVYFAGGFLFSVLVGLMLVTCGSMSLRKYQLFHGATVTASLAQESPMKHRATFPEGAPFVLSFNTMGIALQDETQALRGETRPSR